MTIRIVSSAPAGFTRVALMGGKQTELIRGGSGQVLEIGVGPLKDLTRRSYLRLLRRIIREARSRSLTKLVVDSRELFIKRFVKTPREFGELVAVQFELANYEFDRYKTKKKSDEPPVAVADVAVLGSRGMEAGIEKGRIIGSEVNAARDLANTPGGDMTPKTLAAAAVKAAEGLPIRVTVWGPKELKQEKMGALLGVSKGSTEEPRFIIMEYRRGKRSDKPLVLVGKGITFDSGGLNLKPTDGLDGMHMDMTGAATVLHAIVAAAKLKLKKNVIALLPAAENMVSGGSYRPGDVLISKSGITIEIGNTDAEGRLVLADALTQAKQYKPKLVIDVATLTGAAMVALGQRMSALFTNHDRYGGKLALLGDRVGEYVWAMPLWSEYEQDIQGTVADITNSGKTRYGGAIKGATFLHQFAKDYPWTHIDIAPRMTSIEGDFLAKGATGEPVQLLVKAIENV